MTVGILRRCMEECEKSSYKFRVGAVVFKGKRILSSGHNGLRSSTIPNKHKTYHNSLHAEQNALLKLDWSTLKGASILVLKCSKTAKSLSNARPCSMCMKLLSFVGIKNIYFSDVDGSINHITLD